MSLNLLSDKKSKFPRICQATPPPDGAMHALHGRLQWRKVKCDDSIDATQSLCSKIHSVMHSITLVCIAKLLDFSVIYNKMGVLTPTSVRCNQQPSINEVWFTHHCPHFMYQMVAKRK